jgi:hypothetical protein
VTPSPLRQRRFGKGDARLITRVHQVIKSHLCGLWCCTPTAVKRAARENLTRIHITATELLLIITWNRDSSLGTTMCYGLDGRSSNPGSGVELFSTPQRPDRLWGPPSRGVKLTTHLHLVPRSRIAEKYLHSPIHFHGVLLN